MCTGFVNFWGFASQCAQNKVFLQNHGTWDLIISLFKTSFTLHMCPPYSGIWWLLCVMSPPQHNWTPNLVCHYCRWMSCQFVFQFCFPLKPSQFLFWIISSDPRFLTMWSVCVDTGDPGAGEPGGDVHHPGRRWITAMHPGSVISFTIIWTRVPCGITSSHLSSAGTCMWTHMTRGPLSFRRFYALSKFNLFQLIIQVWQWRLVTWLKPN